jgi:hypothetical protein
MANIRLTNQHGGTFVYCAGHLEKHRRNLLGTVQESTSNDACPDCAAEEKDRAAPGVMLAVLLSPEFSHTRFKYNQIHAYVRDHRSPTGVVHAASLDPARFEQLVRAQGLNLSGPLSPTEKL